MTKTKITEIRRAIAILTAALTDATDASPAAPPSPTKLFVERYLEPVEGELMGSTELWRTFQEVVEYGWLPPVSRQQFLRDLTRQMRAVWGVEKRHDLKLEDGGSSFRGFVGIGYRQDIPDEFMQAWNRPTTAIAMTPRPVDSNTAGSAKAGPACPVDPQ